MTSSMWTQRWTLSKRIIVCQWGLLWQQRSSCVKLLHQFAVSAGCFQKVRIGASGRRPDRSQTKSHFLQGVVGTKREQKLDLHLTPNMLLHNCCMFNSTEVLAISTPILWSRSMLKLLRYLFYNCNRFDTSVAFRNYTSVITWLCWANSFITWIWILCISISIPGQH